jgi:hypothetical protein
MADSDKDNGRGHKEPREDVVWAGFRWGEAMTTLACRVSCKFSTGIASVNDAEVKADILQLL